MVPSQVVKMDKIPLTPASKVDKKRLPLPNWQEAASSEYIAPNGAMELTLANQWQVLFDKESSREDDFFALGGQSLLAAQLVRKVESTRQH